MATLAEGQLGAVVERGLQAGPVAGLDPIKEQNVARDGEASGLTGLRRFGVALHLVDGPDFLGRCEPLRDRRGDDKNRP